MHIRHTEHIDGLGYCYSPTPILYHLKDLYNILYEFKLNDRLTNVIKVWHPTYMRGEWTYYLPKDLPYYALNDENKYTIFSSQKPKEFDSLKEFGLIVTSLIDPRVARDLFYFFPEK